jgi:hypothetical protein
VLGDDLLAFGMAEMLRMPARAMQVGVACRHRNLLDAGLVARAHFVSARRPCLHMLNVLLRRSGRTQGESRGAQTERGKISWAADVASER